MSKIVTVFGATGTQGGAVIDALLQESDSPYKIRAVTRDPSSASSKALVERGVEVVTADLSKRDSLRAAMKGAEAVFAVTIVGAGVCLACSMCYRQR